MSEWAQVIGCFFGLYIGFQVALQYGDKHPDPMHPQRLLTMAFGVVLLVLVLSSLFALGLDTLAKMLR